MSDKRRQRRDFIQNMVITVLTVSAVLLFAQLYSLGADSPLHRILAGSGQADASAALTDGRELTAPVRLAVSGPYGRYGSITAVSGEDEALQTLLREVLGSTDTFSPCQQEAFLGALQGSCVYWDYLSPLPLSILARLAGTTGPDEPSARCLLVSGESDPVTLYLWDGGESYLRCATAVSLKNLEQTVARYELGSAVFAADLAPGDPNAGKVTPCSLFLTATPQLPQLLGETPAYDDSALLAELGFNPNTKNRYTDNGTEVISEGGRSLRLRPDGVLIYQSGGDGALTIDAAGEQPTMEEAAVGVNALLERLLAPYAGEEKLYLTAIRQSGALTALRFGYQVGGVPVRFADGDAAAEVTLDWGVVSALTLRIRRYTPGGSGTPLLPLRQALAAAGDGVELAIGYADRGGSTVSASWLAD